MLHLVRQITGSDKKFRKILTGLNRDFYHKTVTTQQVENYISEKAGFNFSSIFNQYLRTTMIPVLEYRIENKAVSYRWSNAVEDLNLPVKVTFGKKLQWITPSSEWKTICPGKWYDGKTFEADKNFYITVKHAG